MLFVGFAPNERHPRPIGLGQRAVSSAPEHGDWGQVEEPMTFRSTLVELRSQVRMLVDFRLHGFQALLQHVARFVSSCERALKLRHLTIAS